MNSIINSKTKRDLGIILLFIATTGVWVRVLQPKSLEMSLLIIGILYYITLVSIQKKLLPFKELGGLALWVSTFAILFKVLGVFFGAIGVIIFLIIIIGKIVIQGVLSKGFKEGVSYIQPLYDEAIPWRRKKKEKKLQEAKSLK